MLRSTLLMAAVLVSVPSLTGCGSATAMKTLSRSVVLDGTVPTDLRIETSNGGIRIEENPTADGMVVLGKVTAGGFSESEANRRLEDFELSVEQTGPHSWSISPITPSSSRNDDGVRFVVTVPSIGDASIRTANGSITIPSSRGDLDLETRNGAISLGDVNGRVVARTRNGPIVCDLPSSAFAGDVELKTDNGPIRFRVAADCVGLLSAGTRNGSVVQERLDGLEAQRSMKNALTLAGEGGASIVLSTANGSIRIEGLPVITAVESP